jgi:hypothetical protein
MLGTPVQHIEELGDQIQLFDLVAQRNYLFVYDIEGCGPF